MGGATLASLQSALAEIYDLPATPDVREYLMTDRVRLEALGGARSSDEQLLVAEEGDVIAGVAIVGVIETPKGLCCWIYGAAGTESRKGQIDAIIASIEAWATGIGCSRIMLQGRRGWLRRLNGYRDTRKVILEKEF